MDVNGFTVVILLPYTQIRNHHIAHLKLLEGYVNSTSIKKNKTIQGAWVAQWGLKK